MAEARLAGVPQRGRVSTLLQGLFCPITVGLPPRMKMEAQGPAGSTLGLGSHTERRALCISQAGSIREFLQRLPIIDRVKQEPDEGLLQHWEAQWQAFLKTLESSSQSDWGPPQLPEDPTPWENTKGFLASFEQVAEACRWPRAEWVTRLLPALSGEAEWAFSQLEDRDREDYGKVKAAILRGIAASREKQRQHFRHFCYQTAVGPRGTYSRLQELCYGWLKADRQSKEQILELLLLEQFLAILPPEIQRWVRECGPESCAQAVNLAEDFLQAQQRQEKQVTMEVAAAAAVSSSSSTIPPLPDMEQRPLCTETKQEEDAREADVLAGQRWRTVDVGDKCPPEDLERVGPCETVAGCAEERTLQESWHKVEFQQGTPAEEKVDGSVPFEGGVYVDLGEIAIQPRLHTGKRPSACGAYGKSCFSRSPSRSATYKRMRKRGKRHRCLVCGKCFLYSSGLVTHQRIHTGEKPYVCSECGKTFICSSDRNRHQRTHTEEKPYECSDCGKRFRQRFSLSRHRRTHAGENPYACSRRGESSVAS